MITSGKKVRSVVNMNFALGERKKVGANSSPLAVSNEKTSNAGNEKHHFFQTKSFLKLRKLSTETFLKEY